MKIVKKLLLVGLVFLTACGGSPVKGPPDSNNPATSTAAPTAQASLTSIRPATVTPPAPAPQTDDLPAYSTPTTTAQPIFLPTLSPVEEAAFRPPLYPTPWALSPHDHFYFAAPIAAMYPGEPEWDYRYGGIFFGPDIIHTGIDIPAPKGTEILAAGPGMVVWAGIGLFTGSKYELEDPYGLAVAIRHDFGYEDQQLYTVYAHMEEVDVVVGQYVHTGDVLGHVGSTGMTTGPHLHFEVRLGKNDFFTTRNPELWLSPPLGDGVLVGRVTSTFGTLLPSYLVTLKSQATGKYYQAYTYGPDVVNCDAYYNENVVMSDLPAGVYELNIPYGALNRIVNIQILPGQVTYFAFHGYTGYDINTVAPTPTPTRPPFNR